MAPSGGTDARGKPAWVADAVFYQIFPDRFARSKRVSKPTNLLSWDSAPTAQGYHGGDLLGIAEHLDYLAELGINALYLTPIFQSAANHRYHTHDYYQVDPLLGGNTALRELIGEAHQRGMRIVLDGVFNHASRGFFQFHDILENGPHSPWLDWFQIDNWPLAPYDGRHPANYVGWANNRALPKFNTNNAAVREFLMQVGEYWVREFDIDGWRLDVPTEIKTPGFWEEFRARTRSVKPDLYLVGEIWRAAPDWVRGDRFDATMNYLFAAATIAFAAGRRVSQKLVADRSYDPYPGIDAVAFDERIRQLLQLYDWDTQLAQLNLLDSHDAPRVLSVARGDKDTLRLATLCQMTFPGAPCVYYGDEIALRGTKRYDRPHRDQDARWPFPWHDQSAWDHDMLAFFREIIALRHKHQVLRHGHFTPLYAVEQTFGFLRGDDQEQLVVLLNSADEPATVNADVAAHIADETPLRCVFGSGCDTRISQGHLRLELPARTACVLAVVS